MGGGRVVSKQNAQQQADEELTRALDLAGIVVPDELLGRLIRAYAVLRQDLDRLHTGMASGKPEEKNT